MKLTKKQIENLSKILSDIGKLVLAILVLGPFVAPERLNLSKFISGIIVSISLFIIALIVDRGE